MTAAVSCPKTGVHTGGNGKTVLCFKGYDLMTKVLDFGNRPFTTLIRQVYQLFQAFHVAYTQLDKKVNPGGPIPDSEGFSEHCCF